MAPPRRAGVGATDKEEGCWQKSKCDTCKYVCQGDAWWLYNCICSPFVLLWRSFRVYLCGCLSVWLFRAFCLVCCTCFEKLFPKVFHFKDKKFPPRAESIVDPNEPPFEDSEFYGMGLGTVSEKISWMRADEILKKTASKRITPNQHKNKEKMDETPRMYLYAGGINPNDILQGKLGDCWLLAALASLAEYPDAIRNCFLQNEANPRGKYRVRMWDCGRKEWKHVSVDDYIPVQTGTAEPYFSNPQGFELWALLIEKAFAKFCGGYAYLDGGRSPWAWHTLTGDNVFSFKKGASDDVWARYLYVFGGSNSKKDQKHTCSLHDTNDRCDSLRMFELLRQFVRQRAVMGASIHDQSLAQHGLVNSHAYSVIDVVHSHGFKLIKLRNPWGRGEWEGDWSDKSSMWSQHPSVKRHCDLTEDPYDGAFWMPFDEFFHRFDRIDVCDRSAHNDLRLDVHEDEGLLGVCKGCCYGCTSFWFLCRGIRTIYCGHRTSTEVEYKKPICNCGKSRGRAWTDTAIV